MRQKLATLCVISIVLLAGCSTFQPGPNPEETPTTDPTKQDAILEASQIHLDATSVTVDTTTTQSIRIENESRDAQPSETITRQDVTTVYNFSQRAYYINGTASQQTNSGSSETQIEAYYSNGTLYQQVMTDNGTIWQGQPSDFSRDAIFNISEMNNEETLEQFTFTNNSDSNGTYVYKADLTNETVYETLIEDSNNRFTTDSYQFFIENANEFSLTVVVDSETNELQRISLSLETVLTGEQIEEANLSEFADSTDLDNITVTVSSTSTKEYSNYNDGQTVTVPTEAKN